MSYKPHSLRGLLEEANKSVRKMISKEEYSASFVGSGDPMCPANYEQANEWIKDRIRVYVNTWVLPRIEAALEKVRK